MDDHWHRTHLALAQSASVRLTLVENEGGFSTTISGKIVVEVESQTKKTLTRKKLCFKVQSRGLDIFETVESV